MRLRASHPFYAQIRQYFIDRIDAGELRPGDRIASERALAEQFGVSRMTVRHALNQLVREGRLQRNGTQGTYVAQPKFEHNAAVLAGFTDAMRAHGITPGATVLRAELIQANQRVARELQLSAGDPVYYVFRLRSANGEPRALEHSYFPASRCPGIETYDLERYSIYHLLRDVYGIQLSRARQALEPTIADDEEATLLGIDPGAPLLLIERTAYDTGDEPVEFARDLYRGDRTRFVAETSLVVMEDEP